MRIPKSDFIKLSDNEISRLRNLHIVREIYQELFGERPDSSWDYLRIVNEIVARQIMIRDAGGRT